MDGTRSIYDVIEAAAVAGDGERGSGFAAPAAGDPPDYLESGGKHCESSKHNQSPAEEKYEVVPCGCRSRFCPHCCVGLGLSLRERLMPVLETFKGLMMWTFTVDPKLFCSPADAFKYVREKRCISNVMRELRRRGFLHSNRYFVVVEWQMGQGEEAGTEMAHWHVLTDAGFIPFELVCDLWNRFRPASAGPVEGERPGFGSVRFSAPQFADFRHAANYACAYLIKCPEKGYPQWVLDRADVHRFSTSRGFWGESPAAADADASAVPEADSSDGDEQEPAEEDAVIPASRTTIRERLAKCGERSVVVRVVECMDQDTGEVSERREFVCRLEVSVNVVAEHLGQQLLVGKRRLRELGRASVDLLSRFRETST